MRFPVEIEGTQELSLMLPQCRDGVDLPRSLLLWRAADPFLAGPRRRGSAVLDASRDEGDSLCCVTRVMVAAAGIELRQAPDPLTASHLVKVDTVQE